MDMWFAPAYSIGTNQGSERKKRSPLDIIFRIGSILSAIGLLVILLFLIANYLTLTYAVFKVPSYLYNTVNEPKLFLLAPIPGILLPLYIGKGGFEAVMFFIVIALFLYYSPVHIFRNEGYSLPSLFRYSLKKKRAPPANSNNSFIMVFQLFLAFLFVSYVINIIFTIMGDQPAVPDDLKEGGNIAKQLYLLADASVYEELVTRVLLIGLPLLILDGIRKRKDRPWYKYLLGGDFKVTPRVYCLAVFSSVLFGLAHQSGWGWWKIIPTTLTGFAFAYLYIRKGLFPAIIMHFLFDYIAMGPRVLQQFTGSSLLMDALFSLGILYVLHLGARYFAYYLLKTIIFHYNGLAGKLGFKMRLLADKKSEFLFTLVMLFLLWAVMIIFIVEEITIEDVSAFFMAFKCTPWV